MIDRIKRVVRDYNFEGEEVEINDHSKLLELGMDSLDIVELGYELEDEFDLPEFFFEDKIELNTSVSDLCKIIEAFK